MHELERWQKCGTGGCEKDGECGFAFYDQVYKIWLSVDPKSGFFLGQFIVCFSVFLDTIQAVNEAHTECTKTSD